MENQGFHKSERKTAQNKLQRGFWLSQDAENHIAWVSKVWSKSLMSVKCKWQNKVGGKVKTLRLEFNHVQEVMIPQRGWKVLIWSPARGHGSDLVLLQVLVRPSRFCWSCLAVSEFQEPQELQRVMVPNPYHFNGCSNNKNFVTLIRTGFKRENCGLHLQFWMERGISSSPK